MNTEMTEGFYCEGCGEFMDDEDHREMIYRGDTEKAKYNLAGAYEGDDWFHIRRYYVGCGGHRHAPCGPMYRAEVTMKIDSEPYFNDEDTRT